MYFHGGGAGSRLYARSLDPIATELKYRLIAPDRPGIGLSDYQPGRTILDWPADVCELADALEIQQFAVFSESGGSPYVAACAYKIHERLTAAAIVAGTCPLDIPGVTQAMSKQQRSMTALVQKAPFWILRAMFGLQFSMARKRPEKFLAQMMKGLPKVDRNALEEDADFRDTMLKGLLEAFRRGSRGPARDVKLVMQGWGFRLEEIPMEIQIWHGEADQNAPIAMARHLERLIPKSRATYYPEEGHISLLHNRAREILTALKT
jgi:pimeloyl-ACP methyl ester carboxylesterase